MTQQSNSSASGHSLDNLLGFYEQANLALRTSLLVVVLWPLSALAGAMILHGSKAQTIIPIIDMIPLVAIFLIVIGAPFGLALLLRDPIAKKGFIFLMGLIGIELAIGAYLTIIPISSDNGLVPLLMLGAMALFFLWVAKFARPLRFVLTIILGVITIVFISGGRPSFSSAMKTAFTPVTRQNFAAQNFPAFTIPVSSDSWTQEVTLPRAWTRFTLTVNRNFDDPSQGTSWFSYRCSGESGQLIDMGVIYKAGHPYAEPLFSSCRGPIQFRGHANLLLERIQEVSTPSQALTPSHTPSSPPGNNMRAHTNSQSEAAPAQPKPFDPDWTKAKRISTDDYILFAAPCILRAANLHCFFRISNYGKQVTASIWNHIGENSTRMIDDQGVEYKALRVYLGSSTDTNEARADLPSNIPVLGSVVFQDVKGKSVTYLEIKVPLFNLYRTLDIQIRDLPIIREQL